MPNIRKSVTKIVGFRVRDDMLEFFNSLENKNEFLVSLVGRCKAFHDFKKAKAQKMLDDENDLFKNV